MSESLGELAAKVKSYVPREARMMSKKKYELWKGVPNDTMQAYTKAWVEEHSKDLNAELAELKVQDEQLEEERKALEKRRAEIEPLRWKIQNKKREIEYAKLLKTSEARDALWDEVQGDRKRAKKQTKE